MVVEVVRFVPVLLILGSLIPDTHAMFRAKKRVEGVKSTIQTNSPAAKIRADNNIVAVYTSDKDGNYTYILGAKVKPGTTAPSGTVKTTVRTGRFAVFTSL